MADGSVLGKPAAPAPGRAPGSAEPPARAPAQPRRRGRPRRDAGPAVTREAIISAGLDSIRNHGLPGLALREVARRLGVSLAAIQHHFATRNDLWRACVDQVMAERVRQLEGLPGGEPGTGIAALLRNQLEQATLRPGLTAAMWHDPEEGAGERLDYLAGACEPVVAGGRRRLQAAIAAGALRQVDPDVVIALLGIGLNSLANAGEGLRRLFDIDLNDPVTRDQFARELADILLNGLLAEREA